MKEVNNASMTYVTENARASGLKCEFVCTICNQQFLKEDVMLQHELEIHFAWAVKPYNLTLLTTLIRIIKVDSNQDGRNLGQELEKALEDFEQVYEEDTSCIECDFVTRTRDDLIGHFKSIHVNQTKEHDGTGANEGIEEDEQRFSRDNVFENEDFKATKERKGFFDFLDEHTPSNTNGAMGSTTPKSPERIEASNVPQKFENNLVANCNASESNDCTKEQVNNEPEFRPPPRKRKKIYRPPILECGFCKQVFNGTRKLQQHAMALHYPDSRCRMCDFQLLQKDSKSVEGFWVTQAQKMNKHMMESHKMTLCGNPGFPCPDCNFIATTMPSLRAHKTRQHRKDTGEATLEEEKHVSDDSVEKMEEFSCDKCPEVKITSSLELKRHLSGSLRHIELCQTCGLPILQTEQRSTNSHQCPAQLGPQKFDKKEKFEFHPSPDGGQSCQLCLWTCSSITTMMRHQALMHLDQRCPYSKCSFTARDRIQLRSHIERQHPDMCSMCAFVAKDKSHNCAEQILLPPEDGFEMANSMVAQIYQGARPCACTSCFQVVSNHPNWHTHQKKCAAIVNNNK